MQKLTHVSCDKVLWKSVSFTLCDVTQGTDQFQVLKQHPPARCWDHLQTWSFIIYEWAKVEREAVNRGLNRKASPWAWNMKSLIRFYDSRYLLNTSKTVSNHWTIQLNQNHASSKCLLAKDQSVQFVTVDVAAWHTLDSLTDNWPRCHNCKWRQGALMPMLCPALRKKVKGVRLGLDIDAGKPDGWLVFVSHQR